jgi:L-fuculose-phosphate aldolase
MTAPAEDGPALRAAVIETARAMNAAGINVNKSGNVSARCTRGAQQGFVVTPTGVPYRDLETDDIVFVTTSGEAAGTQEPSSEWRFHRDIYIARPEFGAIVHTHSPHATALACHGRDCQRFTTWWPPPARRHPLRLVCTFVFGRCRPALRIG